MGHWDILGLLYSMDRAVDFVDVVASEDADLVDTVDALDAVDFLVLSMDAADAQDPHCIVEFVNSGRDSDLMFVFFVGHFAR